MTFTTDVNTESQRVIIYWFDLVKVMSFSQEGVDLGFIIVWYFLILFACV